MVIWELIGPSGGAPARQIFPGSTRGRSVLLRNLLHRMRMPISLCDDGSYEHLGM